ncbi:MAG: hypothetical protein WD471_00800 [Candidatus Paceibacterota bacterium]
MHKHYSLMMVIFIVMVVSFLVFEIGIPTVLEFFRPEFDFQSFSFS